MGWIDGWIDGGMEGQMDGWDAWTDGCNLKAFLLLNIVHSVLLVPSTVLLNT